MNMKKLSLLFFLSLLICGCRDVSGALQRTAKEIPGLVALWDFGGKDYLTAEGGRPGNFYRGDIGGLAVYDRALSDAEMASLSLR